jgi:O-antigen ligase
MRPTVAVAVVVGVIVVWLAWKSVAYPLALAGVPTILTAILGEDPLPKGGVTGLFAAWIGLAVVFALMRGTHSTAVRAVLSAPVLLSLTLLGVMLLRLGSSPAESYGSMKVQLYIADNLAFMGGAVFVGSRRQDLRLALSLTLTVASLAALLLMFKLLSGNLHAAFDSRFSLSAEQYPIYLGRESANGVIIAIYAVLAASRLHARMAAVAVLPLLIAAMLAAGSRGPVVAFAIGSIVILGLVGTSARARRRLLAVGAALLLAAVIVPLALPSSSIGRAVSTLLGTAHGLSSNGRTEIWAQAFSAFARHPLAGVGTGGFAALNPEQLYPHNLFLEMSVELGVLGAILIVGIVVSFGTRMIAAWRTTGGRDMLEAATLISLFVMTFVNSMFSGAIQDNAQLWLWGGIGVGMSARLAAQRRKARQANLSERGSVRARTLDVGEPWPRPNAA